MSNINLDQSMKITCSDSAKYRKALVVIKGHFELTMPTGYQFSPVWKIADRALAETSEGEK